MAEAITTRQEFEFVLGPRQFASLGIVVLTALAVTAGGAYLIGKNAARTIEIRVPSLTPVVQAPIPVEPPKVPVEAESPLEGVPEDGRRYVQLGSVERGFAILMTQGLRKQGIASLMVKGASPAVFRVLAGPYESPEELESAKVKFGEMGLKTFTRKYPEPAAVRP